MTTWVGRPAFRLAKVDTITDVARRMGSGWVIQHPRVGYIAWATPREVALWRALMARQRKPRRHPLVRLYHVMVAGRSLCGGRRLPVTSWPPGVAWCRLGAEDPRDSSLCRTCKRAAAARARRVPR